MSGEDQAVAGDLDEGPAAEPATTGGGESVPEGVDERPALLEISQLTIFANQGRWVLDALDLELARGRSLAITGPSGAGKTTLALALLGHVRDGLVHAGGSVRVLGVPMLGGERSATTVAQLRRERIHYVAQDALAALTPTLRIGGLMAEAVAGAGGGGAEQPDGQATTEGAPAQSERARIEALLELVGLPYDRRTLRRYPHELSGGQRQRLMLAMALVGPPALIVLDEPTAGQDPETRDSLIGELVKIRALTGTSFVTITHDPVAAAELGDVVMELRHGRLSPVDGRVVGRARTPHVRRTHGAAVADRDSETPPRAKRLSAHHLSASQRGVSVLEDIELELRAGECIAIGGRSGAGKTTLARVLVGLHPADSGQILIDGTLVERRLRKRPKAIRRKLALVFQDPFASLNPARRVSSILADAAGVKGARASVAVRQMLVEVGLEAECALRRPHELSGGQQQRVAIARALACEPQVLICDEVTAALDRESRDALCGLLEKLRLRRGLALLVISHDPAVHAQLAQQVLMLDRGRLTPAE